MSNNSIATIAIMGNDIRFQGTGLIDSFACHRLTSTFKTGSCRIIRRSDSLGFVGVIAVIGMLSRLTWLNLLPHRLIKTRQTLSLQKTTADGFAGGDAARRARMKVGDFMTAQVITVRSDSPVSDAARLMLQGKISGLPVIDAGDHVVGIVTEHDLLRRRADGPGPKPPHSLRLTAEPAEITDEAFRFQRVKVEEVMTRDPLTVTEDTPIEEACRVIGERGIKRLPVVRNKRLVGILARADLVRALGIAVGRISRSDERAARAESLMARLQMDSIMHRARSRG